MSISSLKPILSALNVEDLQYDLQGLPQSACLLRHKHYEVWLATAAEIPSILHEIGRLRETAFRQAGEGTGQEIDLDIYDTYYRHLFIWHTQRQEIIGAYRLGFSQDFFAKKGISGFYTWQLFDYGDAFIAKLGACIELGRSFVRVEDQRNFVPLLLLWRGIATIASQNPQYRKLFGPVSISASIPPLFRQLLAESLLKFHRPNEFSTDVYPRYPLTGDVFSPDMMAGIANANSVDELLARFAPTLRMPVLLRQYLALNGQLLAFSVDENFSNTLDGLVLVDLDQVGEQTLSRYMGAEATRIFLNKREFLDEHVVTSESCIA